MTSPNPTPNPGPRDPYEDEKRSPGRLRPWLMTEPSRPTPTPKDPYDH